MKKVVSIVIFLTCMLMFSSCGTELPDNLGNVEVKKEEGGGQGSTDVTGIPSENDNPLPTY